VSGEFGHPENPASTNYSPSAHQILHRIGDRVVQLSVLSHTRMDQYQCPEKYTRNYSTTDERLQIPSEIEWTGMQDFYISGFERFGSA
jgi:hypothetical protein